jgi:WD40 repeat protein
MERLHRLLMCSSADDLKVQAKWDGAAGSSRHDLLSELSREFSLPYLSIGILMNIGMISPQVMIPESRLSELFHQVKDNWMANCLYHNTYESPSLFADHECDREDFPEKLIKTISEHDDEIWYLCFSSDGKKLATAGKDKTCIIYDVQRNFEVLHKFTEHESGVCYIAWSPDNTKIITCTREPDNSLRVWDVNVRTTRSLDTNRTNIAQDGSLMCHLHHFDSPPTVATWLPNGESFLVGSIDKKHALEIWSIYEDSLYLFPYERDRERIYDLALSPDGRRLLAMGETRIYVYDFITREKLNEWHLSSFKMTSISISKDSKYALVSMNPSKIHLIEIESGNTEQVYQSHKQENVIIRSAFGGATGSFVISGSEGKPNLLFLIPELNRQLTNLVKTHGYLSGELEAVNLSKSSLATAMVV